MLFFSSPYELTRKIKILFIGRFLQTVIINATKVNNKITEGGLYRHLLRIGEKCAIQ
jgi:hypothetical protein